MRELERDRNGHPGAPTALTIVGPGRVGRAIAASATAAGIEVVLVGRRRLESRLAGARVVLLCVPDSAIEEVAGTIAGVASNLRLVGHTSGATSLEALAAVADAGASVFSIHPLQTIRGEASEFAGAPCAISGSDRDALSFADELARALGMGPFELAEESRLAYHAAASMASNFLVSLEESASGLLEAAGVAGARELLAPLVLRTAANWAENGAAALTGPIARGDERTVARHLEAVAETDPGLVHLYRVLAERTRAIASGHSEETVA